ncbi:hypothetical protein A0256_14530 [Mucilaginibacter sp. PAMC 26640]|nr:hypothetical protein A0256_14530 [Mucilaginibacter sp. PAMC 26640]
MKKEATAASGSILPPPASLQKQTAFAVCRKSNGFPSITIAAKVALAGIKRQGYTSGQLSFVF